MSRVAENRRALALLEYATSQEFLTQRQGGDDDIPRFKCELGLAECIE